VTYMLREALEPTSLFSIVALVGLSLLVYVIGYLSMGASELERQTYRSFALSTLRSAELHLKRW